MQADLPRTPLATSAVPLPSDSESAPAVGPAGSSGWFADFLGPERVRSVPPIAGWFADLLLPERVRSVPPLTGDNPWQNEPPTIIETTPDRHPPRRHSISSPERMRVIDGPAPSSRLGAKHFADPGGWVPTFDKDSPVPQRPLKSLLFSGGPLQHPASPTDISGPSNERINDQDKPGTIRAASPLQPDIDMGILGQDEPEDAPASPLQPDVDMNILDLGRISKENHACIDEAFGEIFQAFGDLGIRTSLSTTQLLRLFVNRRAGIQSQMNTWNIFQQLFMHESPEEFQKMWAAGLKEGIYKLFRHYKIHLSILTR